MDNSLDSTVQYSTVHCASSRQMYVLDLQDRLSNAKKTQWKKDGAPNLLWLSRMSWQSYL